MLRHLRRLVRQVQSHFDCGFVQGVTSGFAVITAQRFGAGSENGVRRSVATSIILGIAVTIVMTAISVLAARPLLEIMKTPSDIIDDSYNYIIVILKVLRQRYFSTCFQVYSVRSATVKHRLYS